MKDGQVDWWDFDDAAYLAKGALKPGEDPYQASDCFSSRFWDEFQDF